MGCDGEHTIQINSLESIQALMKHAAVALKNFDPPNRIEKRHGPRRMHRVSE